ncbi:MAG TPA: hypothetical protein PKL83_07205, partial [bacterium]|nr:hypothetical protein [bacterium]
DEEADIVASGFSVNCAVLKAGHHGSKSSSSPAFLAAVQPQAVVISVGTDNKFGHPHAEVLERFSGLQVYRTDEQGRIELRLDQRE